jgi:hypothetical protein
MFVHSKMEDDFSSPKSIVDEKEDSFVSMTNPTMEETGELHPESERISPEEKMREILKNFETLKPQLINYSKLSGCEEIVNELYIVCKKVCMKSGSLP